MLARRPDVSSISVSFRNNVQKRLDPTEGTRIRTYTGFTRVGNIAGGRETTLEKGRNVSNFKVMR